MKELPSGLIGEKEGEGGRTTLIESCRQTELAEIEMRSNGKELVYELAFMALPTKTSGKGAKATF